MRKIGCIGTAVALLMLAVVLVLGGGAVAGAACPAPVAPPASPSPVPAPPDGARAEESTYLTFPEWYVVYSAREQATWLAANPPSSFPYLASIGQYWCGYAAVHQLTQGRYPFSPGNHLMLVVVGTSFSAEYAIKAAWEPTVGRLAETLGGRDTPEDAFATRLAADYAAFLDHTPWYDFPFASRLVSLWRDVPLSGPGIPRKLERRLALTPELAAKAVYGFAIGLASGAVYGAEDLRTLVAIETPQDPDPPAPGQLVRRLDDGALLVALPRYAAFTEALRPFLRGGARLRSIAGNDEVMLTIVAPSSYTYDLPDGHALFEQPILTSASLKRVAVLAPVASLHVILDALDDRRMDLEHVYDY